MVPDNAPGGPVSGHVTGQSANDRALNASLASAVDDNAIPSIDTDEE